MGAWGHPLFPGSLGVHLKNGQGVETHTTPNDGKNEDPGQARGLSASEFTEQDHTTSNHGPTVSP